MRDARDAEDALLPRERRPRGPHRRVVPVILQRCLIARGPGRLGHRARRRRAPPQRARTRQDLRRPVSRGRAPDRDLDDQGALAGPTDRRRRCPTTGTSRAPRTATRSRPGPRSRRPLRRAAAGRCARCATCATARASRSPRSRRGSTRTERHLTRRSSAPTRRSPPHSMQADLIPQLFDEWAASLRARRAARPAPLPRARRRRPRRAVRADGAFLQAAPRPQPTDEDVELVRGLDARRLATRRDPLAPRHHP